ncbi:MAG: sugar ABC transporter permease [Gemmatimonadetes bacterium]|jgi:N-acetylglucosamine transport system permease protein|nr:sugar ABC transporter permease [Gemmatimonadota bacterium]MBU09588.1 sugar ABC transporter permease [Gemmatimonadota bacterium]MDP7634809.1 carbohydrate ABC transporter permease [Candidatus Latescibacterota bacterium]HCV25718.1 sugar ABC transporter permease [Candidatus Latescibacterota bacterium]|tara:strand:+ start:1155 stop:2018 length:864 start_codon:yes stop_codon:yes gene_type:complete
MSLSSTSILERLGEHGRKTITQIIFVVYGVIVVFPMVWLLYTAFKPTSELFASAWSLPVEWKLDNFVEAWSEARIGDFFWNSLFVTISTLLVQLFVGSMASYSLAKYRFRAQGILYYGFLAGMMFPLFLGIVPLFFLVKSLGLLDSHLGLIVVYAAFGIPFTVFVLTAFFRTIPTEIMEAGVMDGCGHFSLYWRIMLPLAKPGLTTVGIFTFISIWNEYILALVLLSSSHLRTMPLGIAVLQFVQFYEVDFGALFAGLVIVMLPTLLCYVILQEQITKGMTVGAVKG